VDVTAVDVLAELDKTLHGNGIELCFADDAATLSRLPGRNTAALIEIIMRERTHPEQGFRAAVGIIRLAKSYGHERLEAACARAPAIWHALASQITTNRPPFIVGGPPNPPTPPYGSPGSY
jgi:hypothetical protein